MIYPGRYDMKKESNASKTYCNVKEQKDLVSKMTECDRTQKNHDDTVKCYTQVSEQSRERKGCMYS